ncbi:MAG TPA: calcium-binding protein [Gammaproteobacteria bacterium]
MATIPGGSYDIDFGTHKGDVLFHADGNWIAFGLKGNDVMIGGDGTDIMFGGDGKDTLVGNDGFNLLFGDKGDDVLIGGDSGNFLDGSKGKDTLIGGASDDILIGGEGKDTLYGGDGNDTFVFTSGGGRDIVMDFQEGDVLEIQRNINGLRIHDAEDLLCRIHNDHDGNAVIDLGRGDSITLVNVSAEDIHSDPDSFIRIH